MTAWAKKPDKPGGGKPGDGGGSVGTGTIYYNTNSGEPWSMNPDGSGKTRLLAGGDDASIARHPAEGDRWFLQFRNVEGFNPITMFDAEFWWGDLDDMTAVSFTGDPNPARAWGYVHFYFDIDSADNPNGDPDTFRWYVDFEGTTYGESGVAITGVDQELVIDPGNGPTGTLTINFASTTGHSTFSFRGTILNKTYRSELFAVSEDGQTEVQLTNDSTVQPWGGGDVSRALPRWATDIGVADGKVSYLAQRWGKDALDNDIITERGLFAAEIEWIDGMPQATTDNTMLPVNLPLGPEVRDIIPYDWSPEGDRVVYVDGGSLYVGDAYAEDPGDLIHEGGAGRPVWSPELEDGTSLIAFTSTANDIRTISPDGTSETTIITAGSKIIIRGDMMHWSPEGTHLVYTRVQRKKSDSEHDVYRIGADGSDPTNLTNGIRANCFAMNWRD
jgi:hypothetical protein